MIAKVVNLSRSKNRLVGYVKVKSTDFDKVLKKDKDGKIIPGEFTLKPNEFFYRKFRKECNKRWEINFSVKVIEQSEVESIIDSYSRKIKFCTFQRNKLQTLNSL